MPWKISVKDNKFCVVKESDGSVVKCHATEDAAAAHLKALYVNVDEVAKELITAIQLEQVQSMVTVSKEDDGRYHIVAVSTAAVIDKEDDTFTVQAIDADIARVEQTGVYPEFRVFHSALTGFGMVTKMKRIGIFAIDEGYSYDDPFSISVCEKMLLTNDGRWRASRGFRAKSLDLECNGCSRRLDINLKHMVAGFRCPVCETVHLSIKGGNARYKEVETFDITVTDVPAVIYTSFQAFSTKSQYKEKIMSMKEQLRDRLLAAGIPEDQVATRLESVGETALKEMDIDSIPMATLLKEYGDGDSADDIVLDASAIEAIRNVVKETVISVFNDIEFEFDGAGLVSKEADQTDARLVELGDQITNLTNIVKELALTDVERFKERMASSPRNARKKVVARRKMSADEEEEEEEDEETATIAKETSSWFAPAMNPAKNDGTISDSEGNVFKSMSEMLQASV